MTKFLSMLVAVMLIAGCRGGGNSGVGSFLSSLFDLGSIVSSSSSASGSSFVSSGNSGGSSGSFVSGDSGGIGALAHNTPEPNTMILFSVGLAGLAAAILRKKRRG